MHPDFASITPEFFLEAVIFQTKQGRFAAIGRLADGTVTTIFAALGTQGIAIISLRPASKKEIAAYDEKEV
ncbi:hypothetical protein [Polycladidibacter hongkongensis]|uniref:hypothetical protein n=1 Tax=Polycladidibacter hongkongensis TaxID=1647556 RepID=UPI000831D971|nr:hypothetical protein [Pseudovibrio hongkongensis]